MINKKVISLVLSLALIVSCFASVASLGVYAIDNTKKTTSLQTAPVVTATTAEKKMADAEEGVESSVVASTPRTIDTPYPSTYPKWHCECGNKWAPVSYNDEETAPDDSVCNYLWGEGKCKNEDGLGCDGTLHKWTAISANFASKTGGYFYLTKNVNLTNQCGVASGKVLAIDLNGKTLTQTGGKRMASLRSAAGASFAITDTSSASTGTYLPKVAVDQGVVCWATANGGSDQHIRIYGGNYDFNSITNLTTYGQYGLISGMDTPSSTLSIYEGSKFDASKVAGGSTKRGGGLIETHASSGKINIYGAELIGPSSSRLQGGTINMDSDTAELTIVDSVISGGHSLKDGGNIYTGNATVNINNCDINGGVSGGKGGNIFIGETATVTISNSTITDGTSTSSGTSIYIGGGTVNLNNNTISNLSSDKAIVFNDGTNTTIDGGSITSNVMAVYNNEEKTITINNADINSDTGIAFHNMSTATVTDSDFTSSTNKAFVNQGTATVTDSNFTSTSNQALQNTRVANITGGTFTSGTYTIANNSNNSRLTMTGSTIKSSGSRCINNGTSSSKNTDGTIKTVGVYQAQATLNNCTLTPAESGITIAGAILNYAEFIVDGGTVNGSAVTQSGSAIYNIVPETAPDGGKCTITGGAAVKGVSAPNGGAIYNTGGAYLEIKEGATVSGGTASTNGGNIYNNATLKMNGATVTGGTAGTDGTASNGGNIYNTANGTSTITGCTISGGKSRANGGNVFVGGDMTFENCTITGGETLTTSGKGGNLSVNAANTTTNLTDCTISNGKAKDNGGAMYVGSNNATTTIVNINGCTFENNEVIGTSKFGGDMFVGAATVNIGASETKETTFTGAKSGYRSSTTGHEVLDNSISTNSTEAHVTIKDATSVSNILPRNVGDEGIKIQDTAKVSKLYVEAAVFTVNGNTYDYVDKLMFDFTGNTATQTVDVSPWCASNDKMDRNDFAKAPANVTFNLLATDYRLVNDGTFYDLVVHTRTQCVCGGKAANVGDHVCNNTVEFTEWYDPDTLPTSGNYYLTTNVNIGTKTTTGDLNLDLNGFNIKKTAAVMLFEVAAGKTLNLTDTVGTGSIDGDNIATVADGANIQVKGTFNMFAGTIKNGYANGKKGGNVNVKANAVMNMYGGTIQDGNANKGGNICTDYTTKNTHGVLNMYAGSITGGTAASAGGNLIVYDTSAANVNGTVTGGTAPEKFGPDIFVSYRKDEISNARAGAHLTLGANAVVGTVDAMYPYTTVTKEEGAQVTTLNYDTFNATRTAVKKSAPTAEKQSGENPNSAFNNWYLLARFQKKTEDSINWIRFTSLVDSDKDSYSAAGFYVTIEGEETQNIEIHNVYKTNYEDGNPIQIENYSLAGDYYFHTDLGFSDADITADKTVTIRPYLLDNDGNYYYGAEVSNTLSNIFNN